MYDKDLSVYGEKSFCRNFIATLLTKTYDVLTSFLSVLLYKHVGLRRHRQKDIKNDTRHASHGIVHRAQNTR